MDEIYDNIFEATERYLKQVKVDHTSKSSKDKPRQFFNQKPADKTDSNITAVNIKSNKSRIICILCSNDNKKCEHYLKDCVVYDSPKKKFDKLREIGACTRCSFRNHLAKDCHFVFKQNCRIRKGSHLTYLCLNSNMFRYDTYSWCCSRPSPSSSRWPTSTAISPRSLTGFARLLPRP